MNTLKNALHKTDHALVMTDRALFGTGEAVNPLFSIDKTTAEKIATFRKTHPSISRDLFDHELNATLCGMVERMDREYRGDV